MWRSHGPATEVLRAPTAGHGGLRAPAAGGAATEAGGARTNKN